MNVLLPSLQNLKPFIRSYQRNVSTMLPHPIIYLTTCVLWKTWLMISLFGLQSRCVWHLRPNAWIVWELRLIVFTRAIRCLIWLKDILTHCTHITTTPGLATVVEPLHRLLDRNHPWKWTTECDHAFQCAKALLSSENCAPFLKQVWLKIQIRIYPCRDYVIILAINLWLFKVLQYNEKIFYSSMHQM